jgi:hypothetical protein
VVGDKWKRLKPKTYNLPPESGRGKREEERKKRTLVI